MSDRLLEALKRARKVREEGGYFLIVDIGKYGQAASEAQIQFAKKRIEQHQRAYEREVLMQFGFGADKKGMQELAELMQQEVESVKDLGPAPCEIKRKLKYAKNPMEIKQLNKQLTMAYKKKGKGGSGNGIERR